MSQKYTIDINAKDNTGGVFGSIGGKLGKLGVAAAGVTAAIAALSATIMGAADAADVLVKRMQKLGVAGKDSEKIFQALDTMFRKSGINAETFDRALRQLSTRVNQGVEGNKAYAAVLQKLGGSVLDANGDVKNAAELMATLAVAVEDGKLTVADFAKIVGEKAGPEIFNTFKAMERSGVSFYDAVNDAANNTALLPEGLKKNAAVFQDLIEDLNARWQRFTFWLADNTLPIINPVFEGLIKGIDILGRGFKTLADLVKANVNFILQIWTGARDVMQGSWGFMLGSVYNLFVGTFNDLGNNVDKWINNWAAKIEGFVNPIARRFGQEGISLAGRIDFQGFDEVDTAAQLEKARQGMIKVITAPLDYTNASLDALGNLTKQTENLDDALETATGTYRELELATNNTSTALKTQEEQMKEAVKAFETYEKQMDSVSKSLSDQFVDDLAAGKDALSTFKNFFGNILKEMASQVAQATIMQPLLQGLTNFAGAGSAIGRGANPISAIASGLLGRFGFGGFFATGGAIGAGQVGVVGENGPELVQGPAMVHSNANSRNMLNSADGQIVINYNPQISAIDTQSGRDFLAQHDKTLVALIDKNRNRRGLGGITR
jgi:hypothetical protein